MKIVVSETPAALGKAAAESAAAYLRETIADNGCARLVVSTGASQLPMFEELIKENVDWTKVEMFHLDEYVGLPETHIASFRKYLKERFVSKIPLKNATFVSGDPMDIPALTEMLTKQPIDLGIIGIGENGHIAFNDPPADFETKESYITVELDGDCKKQQVGEGWFPTIDDVPKQAISMTVWRIMQCKKIISVVPYAVKSSAIKKTFTNDVTPLVPATMLKTHPDWELYLDKDSAADTVFPV